MRKNNTESNRKKAVFTAIDALCCIIIILIAWIIIPNILHALPMTPTTSGGVKMSYVITVTDVPESLVSQMHNDQIIYDMETGEVLGTVSSIVSTPYIIKGINQSTGDLVPNTVPGKYNINITIVANAEEVDNNYQVNGITVACGVEYRLRTSSVALNGTCVSLKNQ